MFGIALPASGHADGNDTAPRIALHGGYNWQSGLFVAGVEGDVGFANTKLVVSGTSPFLAVGFGALPRPPTEILQSKFDVSIRLRAGYLVQPGLLVFGTAGYALLDVKGSSIATFGPPGSTDGSSKVLTGFTFGGGTEAALTKHWFARVDYSHTNFGNIDPSLFSSTPSPFITSSGKLTSDLVNVGLSYRF